MSLTMLALRIAAVEALKSGGTLVGTNVLDSQIGAIDLTADGQLSIEQQRPFIAVYTDAAKAPDLSRTGLRANGNVELSLNCGVSMAMAVSDKETGESTIVEGLPATDAHFEAILDVLDVQIGRVLTDPENPWAQVFGDFVQAYVAKEHLRTSSTSDSLRLAAGQTKLTLEVLADPVAGQTLPEGGPWFRFMGLMQEHDIPQHALFVQLLGEPVNEDYPPFERLMGLTVSDSASLQLYSNAGIPLDAVVGEVSSTTGVL